MIGWAPSPETRTGAMAAAGWLDWRDQLAAALDDRLCGIADLERMLAAGEARFMAIGVPEHSGACIVAEIKTFPSGAKAVHGLVAAGDIDQIVEVLIPRAEYWGARHEGCTLAIIESREGWRRVLKSSGYAPFQSSIAKDL